MPFPWKKNRVTRISRIVADLQSPKRGGSLVVETGFPTSLIDLFVKNRSRFTKSKSKKPGRPEIPDPSPPPPPPSPEATPPTPFLEPHDSVVEPPGPNPSVEESSDGYAVSCRVGVCGVGSGPNVVVGVVVKILVVVVLIASVKRITVGITVSAFALVFLEYAGKRVVSSLGPCSNAMVKVESLAQRVTGFVSFQKVLQLKVKNYREVETLQSDVLELRSNANSNSLSIDEIEVVETNIESCLIGPELGSVSGHMKWDCSEFVEDFDSSKPCEVSECKIRGSRSGRFKSKMVMKLVPKKFRGSKKEHKGKEEVEGESVSDVSRGDKSQRFEIQEDEKKKGSELFRKSSKPECVKDDEVDCGITCSQKLEVGMRSEKKIDRVGNSGYTVLLVIALAGLVVGRLPALILLMAWCFMLKIVKALWRY